MKCSSVRVLYKEQRFCRVSSVVRRRRRCVLKVDSIETFETSSRIARLTSIQTRPQRPIHQRLTACPITLDTQHSMHPPSPPTSFAVSSRRRAAVLPRVYGLLDYLAAMPIGVPYVLPQRGQFT